MHLGTTFLIAMILTCGMNMSWAQTDNSAIDVVGLESGQDKDKKATAEEKYMEGIKQFQNGDYQKALELFLSVDQERPGEPNVYNVLGMAYQKLGNNEQALKYFQKAVDIDPDSPEYLVNLAFYYYDQGQCGLALPLFEKSLSLDPQMSGLNKYIEECSKK